MASLHETLQHIDPVPCSAAREVLALAELVFVYHPVQNEVVQQMEDGQAGEEALAKLLLKVTQGGNYQVLQVPLEGKGGARWVFDSSSPARCPVGGAETTSADQHAG